MFSLEPHSPSITVVLSDTSQHSEDSVDASIPPGAEETEPEATSARTSAPEAFAPDTQHAEADRATSGPQPMDVAGRTEAEDNTNAQPEAENSTNAQPEASKDGSEDKQATSPRLPKASHPEASKSVPDTSTAIVPQPQASLQIEVPQAPPPPQGPVRARSLCPK